MSAVLNVKNYYRLPWSYADNAVSWLEPTKQCNLRCEGCYRDTEVDRHKTLSEVKSDLEVFKKYRISDCVSIAGGDPLVHPEIVGIVKLVKDMGWKPILNTNGLALTPELLKDLKRAGAVGFTFHIDTSQNRPAYKHATETQLNEVREKYATMLAREGNVACSFNATVSRTTLHEVPAVMDWAQHNAATVQSMVFILYRSPQLSGDFDYYAQGKKINFGTTYKESQWGEGAKVKATDIIEEFRKSDPLYEPCAYLNGTANPESTKWLMGVRVVSGGKVKGYVTPKFMETAQTLNHAVYGRYLSYASPKTTSKGKLWTTLTGLYDSGMRNIAKKLWLNPTSTFRKAHMQAIMVIQPIDIYADGRQDMCDGCPDMTVHEGKLVWSCRLEEMVNYGCFVTSVPKSVSSSRECGMSAQV